MLSHAHGRPMICKLGRARVNSALWLFDPYCHTYTPTQTASQKFGNTIWCNVFFLCIFSTSVDTEDIKHRSKISVIMQQRKTCSMNGSSKKPFKERWLFFFFIHLNTKLFLVHLHFNVFYISYCLFICSFEAFSKKPFWKNTLHSYGVQTSVYTQNFVYIDKINT